MEILNNQAVKLTVPEHIVSHITDNIEKSEVLEKRGNLADVLVYWGLDEMTRLNSLISFRNRDMQLTKEILFPAMNELHTCMDMMKLMLNAIGVRKHILTEEKYTYLFSVEKVNELVNQGIPFRDAYAKVGNMINEGTFHFDATQQLRHSHEGSIGNLRNDDIAAQMNSVAAAIKIS